MAKKETIKTNKKSPRRATIATLALLGATLGYVGASTDDARDAATPEQREHIASPAITLSMEGAGILCLAYAGILLTKRAKHRNKPTKMAEVKHNIMLRDFVNDWLKDKKPLSCGTLSETEVEQYKEYLSKIDKIPQNSCITSFDAGFYRSSMVSINNSGNSVKEWVHDLKIDLRYKPEQECKCKREDCFENIQSGNCTDPFMIEHVCKKFFADKYKNR